MIDQRLINQLRKATALYYPDTCTLQGEMGSPPTFQQIANVPCRVRPTNPAMPPALAELNNGAPVHELHIPPTYTLVIGWQCVHAGYTYDIKAVENDRFLDVTRCAYMVRITA